MKALVLKLSLRDMLHHRLELLCNLALILGIVVPLLAVLGAKNGLTAGLLDRLNQQPGLLDIETTGNEAVSDAQFDAVAALDGVAFAIQKNRSRNDFMIAKLAEGTRFSNARIIPTRAGDPQLGALAAPTMTNVIVSAGLAAALGAETGDSLTVATDAPGRSRQARTSLIIDAVLPEAALDGVAILVPLTFAEQLEAFAEGFAIPDFGITEGRDLSQRITTYEGLRVTVDQLTDVGPVASQIQAMLNRNTNSKAAQIAGTLLTVQYLARAFAIIALVGAVGVTAALAASLVNAVVRKRRAIATVMLLGAARKDMVLFPVAPALITIMVGLLLSLLCYVGLVALANALQAGGGPGVAMRLPGADIALLLLGGILLAGLVSALAIRKLFSVDPAIILRDQS
ncbi:FtsX-like permease family protein [Yoonia sp. SS1-5]|uniref:FtsX-like permease family protein n=1 Tax=Yoonia rhodophyticola TaxID=3137370 RepID=A0AAN0MCC1_9RHOB